MLVYRKYLEGRNWVMLTDKMETCCLKEKNLKIASLGLPPTNYASLSYSPKFTFPKI